MYARIPGSRGSGGPIYHESEPLPTFGVETWGTRDYSPMTRGRSGLTSCSVNWAAAAWGKCSLACPRGPAHRRQGHPDRASDRSRVPGPVPAGGRGGPEGKRLVHRTRGRRGPGQPDALAGHGICRRALAHRGGARPRTTACEHGAGAGRRAGGEPERHPRRRGGARRPEAVQRAAGRRRATGHRLRDFPGGRGERGHGHQPDDRLARVHVARTGPRHGHQPGQRHLQPGRGAHLRRHGPGTVRYRVARRADVPAGQQPGAAWAAYPANCGG